jgi:hypothetical protein
MWPVLLLAAASSFAWDKHVGLVYSAGERICLAIADDALAIGATVYVVHPGIPTRIQSARVRRVGCPPANKIMTGAWYELNIRADEPMAAIGLARARSATDVDGDGKRELFMRCASTEGLHFTVWTGRTRRWHVYLYLGYDVEPNCTAEEMAVER